MYSNRDAIIVKSEEAIWRLHNQSFFSTRKEESLDIKGIIQILYQLIKMSLFRHCMCTVYIYVEFLQQQWHGAAPHPNPLVLRA